METNARREKSAETLELENFRIRSDGWRESADSKGVLCLVNPSGDVWELAEGNFAGEQLFTWEAAIRETRKARKRMPSFKEWMGILLAQCPSSAPSLGETWIEVPGVAEKLGLNTVGKKAVSAGTLYLQGVHGYYWTHSAYGSYGPHIGISSSGRIGYAYTNYRSYAFSVRCLVDSPSGR